ncbi:hypothetical protein VNI00_010928 [Paramarasmius palmivorus]|uniref:Protein kinase domain-containing protein n=1 Tax=Paramarasmius palmivorus TaxID=297713 RepID=A0AAW0CFV0_9AGAR
MSDIELRKLKLVFREEEAYRKVLEQKGALAQSLLDLLQQLIDGPDIPNYLRTHICKTILRLSDGSDLHPSCLTLHNVAMVGQHPVDVEGGFGDVWMGNLGADKRVVCLKVARVNMSDIKRLLKPFVREALLWRQLKHPNLLPCLGLYYLDNAKERICLVSPWMENGNLVQYLRNRPRESVNHVQLMHDIASGLSHLHALKIIHGDLKGANILITPSSRACIADFGLSRVATSQLFKFTSTKQQMGTVRWSAPELHMGNSATTKSDIYACGCVYYEESILGAYRQIITGLLPFHELSSDGAVVLAIVTGKSPTNPDNFQNLAPTGIWRLMDRCWEPRSMRPKAEDLLTKLRSIDCRVAVTEDWDDSLFTELRNNVDASDLQHNEALAFLKTIELKCHTMSFKDQLRALQLLFRDEEAYRELLSQRGTVAQSLLDWLHRLIDTPELATNLRSSISLTMLRLSKASDFYPNPLTIRGVVKLGEYYGGFGDIWKGCLEGSEQFEYLREAIVWRQLRHPNLLPCLGVYHLDDSERRIYLVTPWMENGDLVRFLRSRPRESVDRVQLMHDIASGLSHLHALKVIHGDLKGTNILITPSYRACIADFGLSQVLDIKLLQDHETSSGDPTGGTLRWSAPEAFSGGPATKAADIYSCGCVYYEAEIPNDAAVIMAVLQGKRPSRPQDMVSDEIWSLIDSCWAHDSHLRPAAEHLLTVLEANGGVTPAKDWDYDLYFEMQNNADHRERYTEALEFLETAAVMYLSRPGQVQPLQVGTDLATQEYDHNTRMNEMLSYQQQVMDEARLNAGNTLTVSERDALLQKEEELYSRKVDEIRAQRESLKLETSQA